MQRGTPGTARAEAERRRALALKALDQRLHAATATVKTQAPPPSAPSGPSVQTQPTPVAPEMSNQAGGMLGETNYNPDGDEGKS